jgi:hypothetical protein
MAVTMTSLITELQPHFVTIESIDPMWTAVLAGILLGFGLLGLYRHRASLGGIGVLAVYMQERFGIRAGLVQLAFDRRRAHRGLSRWPRPSSCSARWSAPLVLNLFLTVNHRADRYIAM